MVRTYFLQACIIISGFSEGAVYLVHFSVSWLFLCKARTLMEVSAFKAEYFKFAVYDKAALISSTVDFALC